MNSFIELLLKKVLTLSWVEDDKHLQWNKSNTSDLLFTSEIFCSKNLTVHCGSIVMKQWYFFIYILTEALWVLLLSSHSLFYIFILKISIYIIGTKIFFFILTTDIFINDQSLSTRITSRPHVTLITSHPLEQLSLLSPF